MKAAFIVTSAINTKFGVFSADERIQQTIDTIKSIKSRCPFGYIVLIEMAGIPLQDKQKAVLQHHVNMIIDYSSDAVVQKIFNSTNNWDIVKSSTELLCFGGALTVLKKQSGHFDRIFKVSGRYLLNEDFNIADYASKQDKIVFAAQKKSQFDPKVTGGVAAQYMSRCWSFPATKIDDIAKQFRAMRRCMHTIVQDGGYIDIEHLLYLYTHPSEIVEVDKIGVQGLLGPNGILVRD